MFHIYYTRLTVTISDTLTLPVFQIIGPMKGVFPTPDTGPFLKATFDIEAKIGCAFKGSIEIFKSTHDIAKLLKSTSDILTPLHGP